MKKYFCFLLALVMMVLCSCSADEISVREIISSMSAADKGAPAGKIYLSNAELGEDEYLSDSLRLALFGMAKEGLERTDSFAIRLSHIRSPYEYAVFKAKTVDDTDEIAKMLRARIDSAHSLAKREGENEGITDSAEIIVRGRFVFLLMTDDNEGLLDAAKKVIG